MLLFLMTIEDSLEDERDRAYITQVYENNKLKLYKIAYGIVKNHHDAEDCVQDVMIALIDHLDTFRAASEIHQKNMLFRICRNIAIDHYRKTAKSRYREVYPEAEEHWDIADDDGRVDELFVRRENRQRLMDMVNSLDDIYSDVLYYFYYMQLSTSQISRMLHISEGNVRMRLTRARRMMLSRWKEELYELRSK